MSSHEHVFPPKRHVASLLLNIKHLGSLSILSPLEIYFSPLIYGILEYSLPLSTFSFVGDKLLMWSLSLMISFDVISLSPFDINFQEGLSGIRRIGLVLETQHKAMDKTVMLVEDKIHWVELDQKKYRTSGKLFFLLRSRWHRMVCFGGTEKIRLDRKLQVGETEFT